MILLKIGIREKEVLSLLIALMLLSLCLFFTTIS